MSRQRRPRIKQRLLVNSREAALNAVQTFNNPLTTFKTETFIVLMNIAWTYLLHAYYRGIGLEYRYFTQGTHRRKFVHLKSGAYKYWDLERCLSVNSCPLDKPTKINLEFLIGLRNEIEHHQSAGADERFTGHYLACCLNYERYICKLFGDRYSLDTAVALTLQFRDFTKPHPAKVAEASLPSNVTKYLNEFDVKYPGGELKSQHFKCRFLFTPLITNKIAQSDTVIEFVRLDSNLGIEINEKYEQIYLKEVEKPKHLPGDIVRIMNEEGFGQFNMHHHTMYWKETDGKNPDKGFGVQIVRTWYWYDRWLNKVREHCEQNRELYL